jgi:hypothetical protein
MEEEVIIPHKTNMFYISVFLKTEDCKEGCPHMQVKIKGKVHPCTGTEALYRLHSPKRIAGSRDIALPFHDHGTRGGCGVSVTPRPLFTPGKDPVPIVQDSYTGSSYIQLNKI